MFLLRGEGRFGVTASKKVGNAVIRARSKRRLRELYRLHRRGLVVQPWDIVANARRSVASAPWQELERDFLSCLQRATEHAPGGERRNDRVDRN